METTILNKKVEARENSLFVSYEVKLPPCPCNEPEFFTAVEKCLQVYISFSNKSIIEDAGAVEFVQNNSDKEDEQSNWKDSVLGLSPWKDKSSSVDFINGTGILWTMLDISDSNKLKCMRILSHWLRCQK
jgi:hypothetical protein